MKMLDIVDVHPHGDGASAKEILEFFKDIAVDVLFQTAKNVLHVFGDTVESYAKLCQGDVDGAKQISKAKVEQFVEGSMAVVDSSVAIGLATYRSMAVNQPIVTSENKALLTHLCQFGIYAGVAGNLMTDDDMNT